MSECLELERWLDEGRPEAGAAARTAHAAGCAWCARALDAAMALEAALAAPAPGRAPPGFTEAVLARVAAAGRAGAGLSAPPERAAGPAHPGRGAGEIGPLSKDVGPVSKGAARRAASWLALALCAVGAAWAGILSWQALAELAPSGVELVAAAGRGAAALDGLLAGWGRAAAGLSPHLQGLAGLAVAALAAAGSWRLFRRAAALGPARLRA